MARGESKPRIVTIGVYGFEEERFFQTLRDAGVDTFYDIRARRGVRGSAYAFGNSARLQRRLGEMGIRYIHSIELAPSQSVRDRQNQADKKSGTGKRGRKVLGEAFVEAYKEERLANFDSAQFIEGLGPDAQVICLFCVEGIPEACHRSLVADKLARDLGLPVEHIRP